MKRIALIVALLVLCQSTAFAIGAAYSGSWYNPEQSGHGFSLEYSVLNDGTPLVVVYWYVYDTEGNPIFLIGMGQPEEGNTITLEFEAPYGMKFGEFDPESTVRGDGGTGVFTFQNEESGTFSYQPSTWIANAYGISAVNTAVVKLLGVDHPNPEIVELHIGAELLTTTDRTGDFPVCFNGDGELLPCASNVQPPSTDPYLGSWSGRMVYDRRSAGTCYDADVYLNISNNSRVAAVQSVRVNRDTGGVSSWTDKQIYWPGIYEGLVTFDFEVFNINKEATISFDTNGSAHGYWNHENGICYGEWTFTKD